MKRDLVNVVGVVSAVLVLAVGGPWIAREVRSLERHGPLAARAEQRIVTLEVAGMTCSGCARKIETRLAAVPGVASADVRLPEGRAYVVCAKDLPDSSLVSAVSWAGFGVAVAR